jgi:hypothetical protein
MVSHYPATEITDKVHHFHVGCLTEISNDTVHCPKCQLNISIFDLRIQHVSQGLLSKNGKLTYDQIRRFYKLVDPKATSPSHLRMSVEHGDAIIVLLLLIGYYPASFRTDPAEPELRACFRRAVSRLKEDPQAKQVVGAFVTMLSRQWMGLQSSSLDEALHWSIQEGSEKFFADILNLRYPPSVDCITSTALLSIMEQIDNGEKPEKLQAILFKQVLITPLRRGEALTEALSAGYSDAAILLSKGEINLDDRCQAIKLAISMGWIAIVKQLFAHPSMKGPLIEEFLTKAVEEKRPESLSVFLTSSISTACLCKALKSAYKQGTEESETLLLLLRDTPEPSRKLVMCELETSQEWDLHTFLSENGWKGSLK